MSKPFAASINTFSDYDTTAPGALFYRAQGGAHACLYFADDGTLHQFAGPYTASPPLGGAVIVGGADEAENPDTGDDMAADTVLLTFAHHDQPTVSLVVIEGGKTVINKKDIPIISGYVGWGDGTGSTIKPPAAAPAV